MLSRRVLFKKILKRTVSRVDMPHSVAVEAELSNEFSALVDTYRRLKIHHKANKIVSLVKYNDFSS